MFLHYNTTVLEEYLESIYAEVGISNPYQITVEELAWRFNVWVHYKPISSRALEAVNSMYSMFLDSRIPADQQRLDFLHELCHLLRHAGNQIIMPESFTRMQETEAARFTLYASMPFSMISRLEFSDRRESAIHMLMQTFDVSLSLAEQRLDQIHRRCLQGMLNTMVKDFEQERPFSESSWSPETNRILNQLDRQLIAKGLPGYHDKGLIW